MDASGNNGINRRTLDAFFELLRSGLWGYDAARTLFDHNTDWQTIYRLSRQQTVAGVVFDGLSNLPAELQPDPSLMRKWYGFVVKIEQSHTLLNNVLGEVYTLYRNNGFTPVLLKGQGVAQSYRNPLRRQCGDIDLYIGEKSYPEATELVESMGWTNEHTTESEKHLHFDYKGVAIENHRIVAKPFTRKADKRFDTAVKEWFPTGVHYEQIGENEIAIPPATFNATFILLHTSNHFFAGGIGLRQLCDWVRLLHTRQNEIDKELLKTYVCNFKLEHIWLIFGCIAVHNLGLPENEMPFYKPKYTVLAERAINIILKEGNFGQYSNRGMRPKGYLSGKFHNFKYSMNRLAGIYYISPKYTMDYLFYFVKIGIRQIIIDKL